MLLLDTSNECTDSFSGRACNFSLLPGHTETHNVSFNTIDWDDLLQRAVQSQDTYGLSLNNLRFFYFPLRNLQKADTITFLVFLLQWLSAFVI